MDILVRSSGQDGIFYRWVVGGGGAICWWDTGRVYYWVEYVSGIMGGLFVTYNGNRWVRMIIVTYIYCAIFSRLRFLWITET